MVSVVLSVALLVVSLAAGALVHWVRSEAGTSTTPLQESAYFLTPGASVTILAPIQFVIVPSSDQPVIWTAYDNGKTYQRGTVHGTAGAGIVVGLPTFTMKPGSWLTIGVTGIHNPLKAWIV
jgi:hypothetical protein